MIFTNLLSAIRSLSFQPFNVVADSSRQFQKALVSWFRKEARKLPWRETNDPYKIWISEIMLQQTTVQTVIPYYKRFLMQFPTVYKLAQAREASVLKLWEGLGYYSRARNLHKASKMIVKEFDGKLPDSLEEIKKLPGIGEYTAGAILAIAYRKSEPALDGNLIRVYSRYFGIKKPVNDPKVLKKLWKIARHLTPTSASELRDFTEGMMDLGATICRPKNAECVRCPMKRGCYALKHELVSKLPNKIKSKGREKQYQHIYWWKRGKKIALLKKGFDPQFPEFHRLPYISKKTDKAPKDQILKEKYAITFRDFLVYVRGSKPPKSIEENIEWVAEFQLKKILLPAIDRRIVDKLGSGR